ncbi:triacylglycerol lipase [Williamsia sp. CHRR-6]|uniref:esterase/lipase family protein n=1 Tax=Williamsia sp. CHRR-6 TaxID=2835871 RepID=UPI001BD96624|nr:GPI inositol-deacylase [Williamsia sp. CHRR-6]MBT0566503.1 alpha/beta hydrolase [Williamsia sp. CHRR-6]
MNDSDENRTSAATDDQRRAEVRALSRLAFSEIAGATAGVADVHSAISSRVFAGLRMGLGDLVAPAQVMHDAIAGGTYAIITTVCETAADIAGETADGWGRPPSQTTKGAMTIAAVNGLIGDHLDEKDSPLAAPMSVRVAGVAVDPDRAALAAAFPQASGRLVVFLHGLMETEAAWTLGGRPTYAQRFADDLGATGVEIRYNTGRHISRNGHDLAVLMDRLVAEWPVPVTEIAVIGHSMGGLVARSACHRGSLDGAAWVQRVRQVVSLGTPHLGAPLARSVHYLSAALDLLPELRPFARLLRRRSAGVRDLFHGSLVDEDWSGRDLDSLEVAAVREIPLLAGVDHCFVSATVTVDPRHPIGRFIGDGLVLTPSASGRNKRRHIGFRDEDGLAVSAANHFTLLNDDRVYAWILARLTPTALLAHG